MFPSSAFVRHTWSGRRCRGAGGGAEEAVRARVRRAWAKFKELSPILTARGASYRIKGKDIQGLRPDCIDIWDCNLGNEDSKFAKSGEDGMDAGEMDVRGVAEG